MLNLKNDEFLLIQTLTLLFLNFLSIYPLRNNFNKDTNNVIKVILFVCLLDIISVIYSSISLFDKNINLSKKKKIKDAIFFYVIATFVIKLALLIYIF